MTLSYGPRPLKVTTGVYTGDGSVGQTVTGLGLLPVVVIIWPNESVDGTAISIFMATAETVADNGSLSIVGTATFETDTVIALAAGAFGVDDAGVDAHPNTNLEVYNYWVLGY